MPRSGNLRRYIKEVAESPRAEKLSFVPPFIILSVELILLNHAIKLGESYVIFLTLFLLFVSVIELVLVIREIDQHRTKNMFDRILTIKLDDFMTETKKTNVKEIVSKFIDRYPMYNKNRSEVYRLTCQIMQTHKDESIEKKYSTKLSSFAKSAKLQNPSDIVASFLKKYPEYGKYRSDLYERACQLLENKK